MNMYVPVCAAVVLTWSVCCHGTTLEWETNKAAALAKAQLENKLVLMLRGDPACSHCIQARDVLCETTNPDIRETINNQYVPWFSDVNLTDEGDEYLESYTIYLYPIFACINPNASEDCLDLSSGDQDTRSFYARLQSHVNAPEERVAFLLFWTKPDKDTFFLLLPLMTDSKPFTDASTVACHLGRLEKEILAPQTAKAKKNRLKARSNTVRLKIKWNPKTGGGMLLCKIKKAALADKIELTDQVIRGSTVVRFCLTIDSQTYTFYPKLEFLRRHKRNKVTTIGWLAGTE